MIQEELLCAYVLDNLCVYSFCFFKFPQEQEDIFNLTDLLNVELGNDNLKIGDLPWRDIIIIGLTFG